MLSKKIAAGVNVCGFDIRYGESANFAKSIDKAEEYLELFKEVGRILGIHTVYSLSNSDLLPQPHIGRGEALLALNDLFAGAASEWLVNHAQECNSLASRALSQESKPIIRESQEIKKIFINHISAQGGSADAFEETVDRIKSETQAAVFATSDNFFIPNLSRIRTLLANAQEEQKTESKSFPDPCGVTFQVQPNQAVVKGDLIATIRNPDNSAYPLLVAAITGEP